ncbi:DNA mismatch repair endonuclease MutL [Singulisphaera sp. Ch08]|uniref:DNA mismatch repair protein MutL n=1 Tax=Singulisphaera sp. Ch08 TaxID=3120278 RepID=A0AAU7CCH1_9BACT
MGIIRQLSAAVINQIAAGEVVERPASVVKELLENAIDAGASRIDVAVERGGKDLIRIADNGRGIAADDLPLAFMPHATSKLAEADDLFRIATLGFRGEALAAIAEVSKVRCQTRQADSPEGSEISIDAGVASPIRSCGCPPGTVFEVRNLFANTPVRRTFLKSDSTEAGHVAEIFSRVALAHPTIHLTFRSAGKLVHDLPAVTGINERIAVFFGRELADSLLWIESRIDDIHLWGYVAHPSQSRSSAKGQFLFVGGRYVRDRSLAHALAEAYRGLLMVGRSPVAFLHLDIPPDQVDVNVHPTKVEVRFRDGQRIYSQLLATVRQTFLASDLHSRLQANAEAASSVYSSSEQPPRSEPTSRFSNADPAQARQEVASWFAPAPSSSPPQFKAFPSPGYAGGPVAPPSWSQSLPSSPPQASESPFDEFTNHSAQVSEKPVEVPPLADHEEAASSSGVGLLPDLPLKAFQVHDSYLVAETDDGMMVIDQHALHERILYEELKRRVERGGVESQRLLVPEPVDLPGEEASLILEQRDLLKTLGLEIEPFGGDTVLIHGTPAMLSGVAPERLLRDLAEHFATKPLPPTADAILADLLNMIACKAAVKAGQRLTPDEVQALLERRHLVSDSHHCPHGRPTALIFTKSELERQFGRV